MKFLWQVRPEDIAQFSLPISYQEAEKRVLAFLIAHPGIVELWRRQQDEAMREQARRDGFLRDW